MKRFTRLEMQLDDSGDFIYRASVYREGTIDLPGEVWCSSSGWRTNPDEPLDWLERAYPELAATWGKRG
jgi:hypothetical protein